MTNILSSIMGRGIGGSEYGQIPRGIWGSQKKDVVVVVVVVKGQQEGRHK